MQYLKTEPIIFHSTKRINFKSFYHFKLFSTRANSKFLQCLLFNNGNRIIICAQLNILGDAFLEVPLQRF